MNTLTIILLFSSVIVGAIIVELFNLKKSSNIQILITFSGAYLLAISILHLTPEIFTNTTKNSIGLFVLAGFLLQVLLESFSQGIEHGHLHTNKTIPFSVLISLCLHALLEGVPLSEHLHNHAHSSLLTAIVLHKLPVSIVLMIFFLQSNMSKKRAYILLLSFALMSPLGVFAGNLFDGIVNYQKEITAIVVGIFLHISTTILSESSNEHKFSPQKIIAIIFGVFIAFLGL